MSEFNCKYVSSISFGQNSTLTTRIENDLPTLARGILFIAILLCFAFPVQMNECIIQVSRAQFTARIRDAIFGMEFK